METFNRHTIRFTCCLSTSFQSLSSSFPALRHRLLARLMSLSCSLGFFFFCLLRIKQAKVQILPERILPDPLSAVQLTPLSRLHVQPPAKSQTQSSNQDLCRWKNSQVGHTKLTLLSHISAEWFNKTKTNYLPL